MKKAITLICSGLFLLASCAKGPVPFKQELQIRNTSSAITMADIQEYLSGYKNITPTKSADVRVDPVISRNDTVLYLINYDEGWELLSADRRAPRVFAMCEKGNVTIEQLIGNPTLQAIYDNFVGNMLYLKENPQLEIDEEYQDSWDKVLLPDRYLGDWTLVSTTVYQKDSIQNHLTQTRWGQSTPWNCRLPYMDSTLTTHCYSGCAIVATSQMLYYLHQTLGIPSNAYGESSTSAFIPTGASSLSIGFNDVVFDSSTYSSTTWDNMALTASDTGSFAAVSTLMIELGIRLGAEYKHTGTSASTGMSYNVFRDIYSIDMTTSSTIDYQVIANQIFGSHQPVMLVVSFGEGVNRVGHTVIADACKEQYQVTRQLYQRVIPVPDDDPLLGPNHEFMIVKTYEFQARYLGINWGWDSSYMYENDGSVWWFNTDVINWHVGYIFTTVEDMYYNFRPLSQS